jgi:diaminopimelate decarboxylase
MADLEIDLLDHAASTHTLVTPYYIYDLDVLSTRAALLLQVFRDMFKPSYAIKSNPNLSILRRVISHFDHMDASSAHEVERALAVGVNPEAISWSGPGKKRSELTALAGKGINIVVEAEDEIRCLAEICEGFTQKVIIRINPDHVPKGFGASMAGKPSQFGIDEPEIGSAIDLINRSQGLQLVGFHAYTGSMCLQPEPIAQNIENLCHIFKTAADIAQIEPEIIIFGAGFGIPLHDNQAPLDLVATRDLIAPHIENIRDCAVLGGATRLLEIGRWISGPMGALVTEVISTKVSRGTDIAICDTGFNNHLAACGMMGGVFHRNYPFKHLATDAADREIIEQMVAGPLCTSIDLLSKKIELPLLKPGDRLGISASGAYGLTASPTRFISHSEPAEYVIEDRAIRDVSESRLNQFGSLVEGLV